MQLSLQPNPQAGAGQAVAPTQLRLTVPAQGANNQHVVNQNGQAVGLTVINPRLPQVTPIRGTQQLAYEATRYQAYDHRTHVYKIPDTYIGSAEKQSRMSILLDTADPRNLKMVERMIELPEGVERLFLEVATNAGDNVRESRLAGINPDKIIVTMDRKTISVRNGGRVIPIKIHPTEGIYVAEMILGRLLTSSNYDQNTQRTGAGRNGYGAKITNVFSHYFKVEIGDPQAQLSYSQEWKENMKHRTDPIITPGYTGEPFVQVTYVMDQERFGYQEYPDEAFTLFARHSAEIAFNHKIAVHFNGIRLYFNNIKEFAKCRFGADVKMMVHYEWPMGTPIRRQKNGLVISTNSNALPSLEMALVDAPGEGRFVAFTNAMINTEGGVHVDAVMAAIQKPILNKINRVVNRTKRGKGEKAGPTLTGVDLRRRVSVIVSYRAINAKFRGQTKEKLVSPKPTVHIEEERFNCINSWNLVDRLIRALEAKQERILARTDGKRKRHVNVPSSEDANLAGRGRHSAKCTLVITEGDSAMAYALKLFANIGIHFRDYYGFLPLRGKLLNVRGAPKMKIAGNKEIGGLKKLLGLREGVDYSKPEEKATLRYHQICIITDPDVDGKHITGLFLNYLDQRFPSLLLKEMVYYIKVPILRLSKGGTTLKFYSLAEYEEWVRQTADAKQWRPQYFKGLGTSEDKEIDEDFATLYAVRIFYDQHAKRYLDLAFNPKMVNFRKDLIERYTPDQTKERFTKQSISHIVNFDVIEFSVADVQRSIPGFDGLKDSQRRIVNGLLKKWGKKIGKGRLNPMKVGRLGPYVANKTRYHHGEKSLIDTAVGMAQDFTGSNNLPHLYPKGQFGTRNKNGKDAAQARYTFTYPMWWLRLVYRPEDDGILTIGTDEGKPIGYERFKPIIPISLVNGCLGIATGFSTFIPPHNPIDLCIWIILRMNQLKPPTLIPWYRGFTGEVVVATSRGGKRITGKNDGGVTLRINSTGQVVPPNPLSDISADESDENDENEEIVEGMGEDNLEFDLGTRRASVGERKSVYTRGTFVQGGNTVVISELPINRSIHGYDAWLRKLCDDKVIQDYQNHSHPNKPHFTIVGMKNPTIRKLRLERSFGLSNMVLLDDEGRPRYYKSTEDLMKTFYHSRLLAYQARKELMIQKQEAKIADLVNRLRFVEAVVNGTLVVLRRITNDIYLDMDRLQLARELLKKVKLHQCTADGIALLEGKIQQARSELVIIRQLQPIKVWEKELLEFVQAYLKHHPEQADHFTNPLLQRTIFSKFYRPAQNVIGGLHLILS